MGNAYVKNESGVWVPNLTPFARTATGFARTKAGYRKTTATTWSQFLTVDNTPPAAPVISPVAIDASGRATVTIKAPANTDVRTIRVKIGKKVASNSDSGSDYYSSPDGADLAWSEWKVSPGQSRSKFYPLVGELTVGTTYYITAWAQDTSRNFSAPATMSFKYAGAAVKPLVNKSAYVTTNDSTSFRRVTNTYERDAKYLRVGGPNGAFGIWYYGTKFQALLANAKKLTKVTISVQRVNAFNYEGASRFKLFSHKMPAWRNVDFDNPNQVIEADGTKIFSLKRGQSITITVPPVWYPLLLTGKISGFGIYSQTSSGSNTTDFWEGTYQGYGTNSGRVYFEYVE